MAENLKNEKAVDNTHLSDQRTEVADKESVMEKHIVGENAISYTLGADESRSRGYGKAEGNRPDEMGWIDE